MQLSFGSGAVWGERTDVIGSGIGPRQFGVLQDIQIDFDWTDKELYGQLQFPVAVARGQGKITGKAKFAQILGLLYSDIFFGLTPATRTICRRAARSRHGARGDALHGHGRQCGKLQRRSGCRVRRHWQAIQSGHHAFGRWSIFRKFRHWHLHLFLCRCQRHAVDFLHL